MHQGTTKKVLIAAAWFGLVTGMVEGVLFLLLKMDVTVEILWIAAVFNLLIYTGVGLAFIGVARVLPQLTFRYVGVGLFALIVCLNWLGLLLAEWIKSYAIVLLALGIAVQFTRWFSKREQAVVGFWRKSLPAVAIVALLILVGIKSGLWLQQRAAKSNIPDASERAPNVIVIVVDTLRSDHLSSYGYHRLTSPNIDRLAREGVLFEHAFSASSYTLPSHASLLTGRHAFEHQAEWTNRTALKHGLYPTLPDVLKTRGYLSAGFSANLFWFTRQYGFDRGFTHFEDFFQSTSDMVLRTFYGRAFERFVMRRLGYLDIPARLSASDINQSLLRWIDTNPGRPFFAFVNYMDTHDPYMPPAPFRNKFSVQENPGGRLNWRIGLDHPRLSAEQLRGEIDAYDGAIAFVDEQIGHLLHEFEKRGLTENTIIVITSDHGESFGEHGLFLHGHSLYRETIHVPLILWQPGNVPGGIRVEKPVSNVALAATLLDLIDVKGVQDFPGPSLTLYWKSPDLVVPGPYPLSELAKQDWVRDTYPVRHGSMRSVINDEWHYISNEKLGVELYGWKNDPSELNNMSEEPEAQNVVLHFQKQLSNGLLSGSKAPYVIQK